MVAMMSGMYAIFFLVIQVFKMFVKKILLFCATNSSIGVSVIISFFQVQSCRNSDAGRYPRHHRQPCRGWKVVIISIIMMITALFNVHQHHYRSYPNKLFPFYLPGTRRWIGWTQIESFCFSNILVSSTVPYGDCHDYHCNLMCQDC